MTRTTPNATIRRAADAIGLAAAGAKHSATGRWYVATKQGDYPQTINEPGTPTLVAQTYDGPQHPQCPDNPERERDDEDVEWQDTDD